MAVEPESGATEPAAGPGNGDPIRPGLDAIRILSGEIGPRAPCSPAEQQAAEYVASELQGLGLAPETGTFRSGRSFGPVYLLIFGAALIGGLLQRVRGLRLIGHLVAGLGAFTALKESRFSQSGPAWLLRRGQSRNVSAVIESREPAIRTVCLVSHLDSSRSGLMFHPRVTPRLGILVTGAGVAALLQALAGPLERIRLIRPVIRASRCLVAFGTVLVAEREIRGQDVPGANDNASGVGACLALAHSLATEPLERTRVVILTTGSEESGPLGIKAFLAGHDTEGWLFLNFDGVGADAPLRVLAREGGPLAPIAADAGLLRIAEDVGRDDPELAAPPLDFGSGLPYDSTPVLVAGGRALSIVNQGEGAIPDYHWPTDRLDRISPEAFSRAVRFGRALLDRIDRAEDAA